jgi:hypothetical protein
MFSRLRAAAALASLASTAFLGIALAESAYADPAAVTVGDVRAPINRQGATLRATPKMGAEILGNLPHGSRFLVEETRDVNGIPWVRVSGETTDAAGAKARKTGWLRSADTVDPYALTGPGRLGTSTAAGGSTAAAAGRGFGPRTEEGLIQSDAKIAAAMPQVDRLESVKPSPHAVQTFAQQGRLGFPGRTR